MTKNEPKKSAIELLEIAKKRGATGFLDLITYYIDHVNDLEERLFALESKSAPSNVCVCRDVKLANSVGLIRDDIICDMHPTNNANPKPSSEPKVDLSPAIAVLSARLRETQVILEKPTACNEKEIWLSETRCEEVKSLKAALEILTAHEAKEVK